MVIFTFKNSKRCNTYPLIVILYCSYISAKANLQIMEHKAKSMRPFIGAKNFEISRNFYRDLGFEEVIIEPKLSVFKTGQQAFYLQDYYTKDWIDNTMIFLEVEDVTNFWEELQKLDLVNKYDGVRLVPVKTNPWGRECFVHDPSGVLWHFGEFF